MASSSASCKHTHTLAHRNTHTLTHINTPPPIPSVIPPYVLIFLLCCCVLQNFRFKKLATDNIVTGTAVLMFAKGGSDRASLDLPARLGSPKSIPPKINAALKKIVAAVESWPTTDKNLEYVEFAGMFGFSENQALEAEKAAAAVRIQAMSRRKKGNAVAIDRRRRAMESQEAGGYTKKL